MKFASLRSIAHNIADSIADGTSFLFGFYDLDVFGEADRTMRGYIEVDLLKGVCSESDISAQLASVLKTSTDILQSLCKKHGESASAFHELRIRFLAGPPPRRYVVTVQNEAGRRSVDEYVDGKRPRILDHLGRVRKLPPGARARSASKYS